MTNEDIEHVLAILLVEDFRNADTMPAPRQDGTEEEN